MDDEQVLNGTPEPAAAEAPAGGTPAAEEAPGAPEPQGTQDPIEAARQRLANGEPLVPEGEEEEAPPDGGEEGEEKQFTVKLRGIPDRGEPETIELEAPDQESFQLLNRLQNEAELGRQVKEERRGMQRQQEQLAEVEDMIAVDPTGFIVQNIPAEIRQQVAMQLLFEDGVLDALNAGIRERLGEDQFDGDLASLMQDPAALRTLRAELKNERHEMRDELRNRNQQRREMRANAERVAVEIERLIPENLPEAKRQTLFRECLQDVKERADRLGIRKMDPSDVALLVSQRFRDQGIEMVLNRSGGSGNGAKAPGGTAAAAGGRTAQQFQQARETRRAAAVTAPPGAGAPGAKPRPDLPKTTDERIKLARKTGLRALLGHS